MLTYKLSPAVFFGIIALVLFFAVATVHASVTMTVPTKPAGTYQNYTFFSAQTASLTSSTYFSIAGAKKVTFYFTHGGTATTSTSGSKFTVQTTRDGVTWDSFNKLIGSDVASTATTSVSIQGATTTVSVGMDLSKDTFFATRCISTEFIDPQSGDGEQTCQASVEF